MSTVYIIHEAVFNGKPVLDTSPADEFGKRCVLVRTKGKSNALIFDEKGVVVDERTKNIDGNFDDAAAELIRKGLCNFTRDDYLVMIGAPKLIAAAGAIAARNSGGFLRLLVWNDRQFRYDPIVMRLWEQEGSAGHGRISREFAGSEDKELVEREAG